MQREMVGKQIGCGIERGDGSTIARRRFAAYGPAVGNVAIIHTRIPEVIALEEQTAYTAATFSGVSGREKEV